MYFSIFTVHDIKAEAYLPPFTLPTRGLAIRAFNTMANDATHAFSQHPEDYTLFVLGTFDDSTGLIKPFATPEPIGKAIDFIEPSSNGKGS